MSIGQLSAGSGAWVSGENYDDITCIILTNGNNIICIISIMMSRCPSCYLTLPVPCPVDIHDLQCKLQCWFL